MRPSVDMNTDVSSKRVEGNRTNFPEGFLYAAKPWPRIWAYWADTLVFSLAGGFLIGLLSYWSGSPTPEFVSNEFALSLLLSWTLIPFLIAMSQAAFGTTLGKALFGIRVLQPDGNNPSFGQAISRSYSVLVSGLYLGIPIAYLFGANKFIRDLQKGVKPSWDLGETSAYQCHPEKNRTGMMWVVAVLGILAIGLIKELGKSR